MIHRYTEFDRKRENAKKAIEDNRNNLAVIIPDSLTREEGLVDGDRKEPTETSDPNSPELPE
jgi:hypothetical protein